MKRHLLTRRFLFVAAVGILFFLSPWAHRVSAQAELDESWNSGLRAILPRPTVAVPPPTSTAKPTATSRPLPTLTPKPTAASTTQFTPTAVPALSDIRRSVLAAMQAAQARATQRASISTPTSTPLPSIIRFAARSPTPITKADVTDGFRPIINAVFTSLDLEPPNVPIYSRLHPTCSNPPISTRTGKEILGAAHALDEWVCLYHPEVHDPKGRILWHELAHIYLDHSECQQYAHTEKWDGCIHDEEFLALERLLWSQTIKLSRRGLLPKQS